MKLSVFVVTYNQEKYIRQCLDSILMQKVDFDYEVVIGEDHSTDGTRSICEEYAAKHPQIRLLPLTENLGVAGNWKRVLLECKGKYVAMCEGDDYWIDDNKLQMEADLLDSDKEIGYVFTKNAILTEEGEILHRDAIFEQVPAKMDLHMLTKLWLPSHTQTICFRRNLLPEPYPEEMETSDYVCDIYLKYLVASKCKIGFINKTTAVYRLGGVTGNQRDMESYAKRRRSDLAKLDKLTNHEYSYFLINYWAAHEYEQMTTFFLAAGNKFKATKYFVLKILYDIIYNPPILGANIRLNFINHYLKNMMSLKKRN